MMMRLRPTRYYPSVRTHRYASSVAARAPQSTIAATTTDDTPETSQQLLNHPASSMHKPLNPPPDFSDASLAYKSSTLPDLVRAWISLTLCQWPTLVQHAPTLHRWGRRIVGDTITDFALQQSFFGHFCGGVDAKSLGPKIKRLEQQGVGSIFDYAAEDETTNSDSNESDVARVYTYETEQQCDRHLATFQKCVEAVKEHGKDGFAAVKVTALGNPRLLEKMSVALMETQNLFAKFDKNQNGFISKAEFEEGCRIFFRDGITIQELLLQDDNDDSHFRHDMSGDVDYITWSMLLAPRHLPHITRNCRDTSGPLSRATPTERELELMVRMFDRGHTLAQSASTHGTRLLMDAEQYRVQPAIDNLVLDLQRNFNNIPSDNNRTIPIVYNTYQCYLKDSLGRLYSDVQRAERYDYAFGAKLVRGAYMESERQEALDKGMEECPIYDTKEETDANYDAAVDYLLQAASKNNSMELMLATHNQPSIETAVEGMNRYGIDRRDPSVSFGQLLGMMDNLTFGLGRNGYRAYKYVPYGEVKMVMPYLMRRANENSSLAGGAGQELSLIQSELRRRILPL